MNLISLIPIGKKYKKTRQQLMYEAQINDKEYFQEAIRELRKKYLIMFDNGYYLPASREEYLEIIEKMEKQAVEINDRLKIAYEEMGEI